MLVGGSACARAAQGSTSYDHRTTGQAKGSGSSRCVVPTPRGVRARVRAVFRPRPVPCGIGCLGLSQQGACFPPGAVSSFQASPPVCFFLQCSENVILSGQGCEGLWEQGEVCCGVMGVPQGLVSELKACQSWRSCQRPAAPARRLLPGPRQPTSTSPWGS